MLWGLSVFIVATAAAISDTIINDVHMNRSTGVFARACSGDDLGFDGNLWLRLRNETAPGGAVTVFNTSLRVLGDSLVLQADGNFVIYSRADGPLWDTATYPGYAFLPYRVRVLQTGRWVLLDKNLKVLFTSDNSTREVVRPCVTDTTTTTTTTAATTAAATAAPGTTRAPNTVDISRTSRTVQPTTTSSTTSSITSTSTATTSSAASTIFSSTSTAAAVTSTMAAASPSVIDVAVIGGAVGGSLAAVLVIGVAVALVCRARRSAGERIVEPQAPPAPRDNYHQIPVMESARSHRSEYSVGDLSLQDSRGSVGTFRSSNS